MPAPVLLVVTAADSLTLADGSAVPAGYRPAEVLEPAEVLAQAGYAITIASPSGMPLTAEPGSPDVAQFLGRLPGLGEPTALSHIEDAATCAAVVVAGGYGALQDLDRDPQLGRILREAVEAAVPILCIGHGAAGLLQTESVRGDWALSGKRMTTTSMAEEGEWATRLRVRVADELAAAGALLSFAEPFEPHVVVDGTLVTAQNTASARPAAQALVDLLG